MQLCSTWKAVLDVQYRCTITLLLFIDWTFSVFLCVQIEQQKKQKKHKDTKKKKKKKHKQKDSSDNDLLRQYLAIVNRKKSAEIRSPEQEHESGHTAADVSHQSSDRSHSDKHKRPTSGSDRDRDEDRHLSRRSPDRNTHDDKRGRKIHHGSRSADDSIRKHSDESKRNYSNHSRDDPDGVESKRRRPTGDDRSESNDKRHSHSKRHSKDLQRRHSSETKHDTSEVVHRSSDDEKPDNGEGKIAGYGLIVS